MARLLSGAVLALATWGCVIRTADDSDNTASEETPAAQPWPPTPSPSWPTKPSPTGGVPCVGMLAMDEFGKLYVTKYLCQGPQPPMPDPADDTPGAPTTRWP